MLSYALSFRPQSSAKLKVLWRYIILVSFISIAFVVAKLWVFKCFRSSKTYHCSQILLKFGTVMRCNITHHIYYGFWYSSENSKKLSQKTDFLALFQRFLIYALLHPKSYAPVFSKWKVSWRYIIMVSFIGVAFVIAKLSIFKCFHGSATSMKWHFLRGFWALTPPNIARFCWNFYQRYYSRIHKQCLKNFGKIQIFTEMGDTQSFQVWSNFDPLFPSEDGWNQKK